MWAEEKCEVKPDREPLLIGGGATGKRLCLSCRLMIFFLKLSETF
jgi:hypothetical protein